MKYHICESTSHFSSLCPNRQSRSRVEEANMSINITLISGRGDEEQCLLLAESIGYGVLDSACTKTVAGEAWMNEFLATLSKEKYLQVKKSERKTKSVYRFGDGIESYSLKTLDLPVQIGRQSHILEVDVVTNDIPLLISKPSMSRMKVKIDC